MKKLEQIESVEIKVTSLNKDGNKVYHTFSMNPDDVRIMWGGGLVTVDGVYKGFVLDFDERRAVRLENKWSTEGIDVV